MSVYVCVLVFVGRLSTHSKTKRKSECASICVRMVSVGVGASVGAGASALHASGVHTCVSRNGVG